MSRQYDRAVQQFDRCLELEPDYFEVYVLRGATYLDLRRYEDAIRDCTRAIELNPAYPAAYLRRADAYRETGELNLAISDYDQAIRLKRDSADAHLNRAIAYYHFGSTEKGDNDLATATALAKGNSETLAKINSARAQRSRHTLAANDKVTASPCLLHQAQSVLILKIDQPKAGYLVLLKQSDVRKTAQGTGQPQSMAALAVTSLILEAIAKSSGSNDLVQAAQSLKTAVANNNVQGTEHRGLPDTAVRVAGIDQSWSVPIFTLAWSSAENDESRTTETSNESPAIPAGKTGAQNTVDIVPNEAFREGEELMARGDVNGAFHRFLEAIEADPSIASHAVPHIVRIVKETPGMNIRADACSLLGQIGSESSEAVDVLRQVVQGRFPDPSDTYDYVRKAAIKALGSIGPSAKAALPELLKVCDICQRPGSGRRGAVQVPVQVWSILQETVKTLVLVAPKEREVFGKLVSIVYTYQSDRSLLRDVADAFSITGRDGREYLERQRQLVDSPSWKMAVSDILKQMRSS